MNLAPFLPQLLAEDPFQFTIPQTLLSVWQLRASLFFTLGCGTENGVEEAQGLGENSPCVLGPDKASLANRNTLP